MIAIPINKIGEEPVVSDVFAKSKWFAIVDGDTVTFEKNTHKSGVAVSIWLKDLGVKRIVTHKIGSTTFDKLTKLNILCMYTDLKVKLTTIIEKASSSQLNRLNIQKSVFQKICNH